MSDEIPKLQIKTFKIKAIEKKVADAILAGETYSSAGRKIYKKDIEQGIKKESTIYLCVARIMNKPLVQEYLEYNKKLLQEQLISQQVWEKTHSIQELRRLIAINSHEQDRASLAAADEIEFLLTELQDAEEENNDKKCKEITKKIFARQKAVRISKVANEAILGAVAELDKMHGYNQENVAYTETVIFEDTEIPD